jgi:isopenicillin N synthase-like dioxygenase
VKPWIRGEEFVWEGTSHLPGFKDEVLGYWAACLTLARKLVKVFALSLGLPESYFDSRTTYPGADGVFNYYPTTTEEETVNNAVGLGSHTDLQLFTLLWQDMTGGLQVLNRDGQWIKATPVEGTIVVNIGDFMMRLCNDIYKSTVHRVYNRSTIERVSMPFFFGEYKFFGTFMSRSLTRSRAQLQLRGRCGSLLYFRNESAKIRANFMW